LLSPELKPHYHQKKKKEKKKTLPDPISIHKLKDVAHACDPSYVEAVGKRIAAPIKSEILPEK
jgi:hypothetical protein